jgi:hypothetical protein
MFTEEKDRQTRQKKTPTFFVWKNPENARPLCPDAVHLRHGKDLGGLS